MERMEPDQAGTQRLRERLVTRHSGLFEIEFRGTLLEVIYTRTADDVEWWFSDDHLNDKLRLTGQERRDIWREVWERSK
jgi:hypothetical protein